MYVTHVHVYEYDNMLSWYPEEPVFSSQVMLASNMLGQDSS